MQITLTDEEAESFKRFRQYQGVFEILDRSGVFAITNGSAELHFDSTGQIASINTHMAVFRRMKVSLSPYSGIAITKK